MKLIRRAFDAVIIGLAVMAIFLSARMALALEPADNGIWSSDQTKSQGVVGVYAPLTDPAIVFFWFTYTEDGEQAWFISDNVSLDGPTETMVDIFKPIGRFLSKDAVRGEPVGVMAYSRDGANIVVRFGISPIEGFTESCADEIQLPVRPSPRPPPISPDLYPCQSELTLYRISPAIPALM